MGFMRMASQRRVAGAARRASTSSLRLALEGVLGKYYGRPRRIKRLRRRISDYSTSFKLEELEIWLDGGERLELILKDLSWHSLLPEARDVRPRFLYDGGREIHVYQSLLADRGLGTARCYGAVIDSEADRYWLILERVPGAKLCHVGDFGTWKLAARWLARLHAAFAPGIADVDARPLLHYDAAFYQTWLNRLHSFIAGGAATHSASDLQRLSERYARAVTRLAALHVGVIHGEFYPSNILVPTDVVRGLCPVDWEMAAIGPGLMDLAALCAGEWTEEQRLEMIDAYRQAASQSGATMAPMSNLRAILADCQLHLAIQWVCWSTNWTAPADQARDWLNEAIRIAAETEFGTPDERG